MSMMKAARGCCSLLQENLNAVKLSAVQILEILSKFAHEILAHGNRVFSTRPLIAMSMYSG